jgi:aryl-alcohol dehydrogenase-like predicted oxidoreductase
MRIQVGTAQFGNVYGITNENIELSPKLCWQMLDLALENGVNEVDTSPSYGNAMDILAKYRGGRLNITSKIKVKGLSTKNIVDSLKNQENKIGKFHFIHRVLIHDFTSLSSEELRMLQRVKEKYNIGASIYESKELSLVKKYIGIDVPIQLPISILNQTFTKTIKNPDNQLFDFTARSLMLQGVLDWESKKNPFKNHPSVIKLKRLGKLMGLKPIELAVNFAKQLNGWACQAGTTVDPSKIQQFKPHLLESEPIFEDGIVKTSLGRKFVIVHQYDRVPEWKKFVEKKYGQEDLITFRTQ